MPAECINWDEVGLGQRADAIVALDLGVHTSTVQRHRRKRRISPCMFSHTGIDWDALGIGFGQRSDKTIADEIGVSPSTVRAQRNKREISAFAGGGTPPKRGDIDWDTVGLGCRLDLEIAQEHCVNPSTVAYHRRKRGLSPYRRLVPSIESCFGLYWLGLFSGAEECEVPSCQEEGCVHAVFLLRGHVVTLELCEVHGGRVEIWAATHHPQIVHELVVALRSPPVIRELSYVKA